MGIEWIPEPVGQMTPQAPLTPGELVLRPAAAPARCPYCRRYGRLGQCEGCGAPNEPTATRGEVRPRSVPAFPPNRVIRS